MLILDVNVPSLNGFELLKYVSCTSIDAQTYVAVHRSMLRRDKFDLLILDVNVPSLNGFELLKELKSNSINIPCIYITSLHTSKDMEDGFKAGLMIILKNLFI